MLYSYSYFRVIPKISQATGLGDPECGCSLSPLVFLRQGAREMMANYLPLLPPRPVRRHDCNRGQPPASSEVSDENTRQD
ncbi:hypothetical protein ES703_63099 [subsurface metagenome]